MSVSVCVMKRMCVRGMKKTYAMCVCVLRSCVLLLRSCVLYRVCSLEHVISRRHFPRKVKCWQDVVLLQRAHFIENTFCRELILMRTHFVENTFYRKNPLA